MAKVKRPDTPLADTPDSEKTPFDLKTALADINTRISARQTAMNESMQKSNAARAARSKERKNVAGEGGRLSGLATFASTTGRSNN
jgi:hypothetical protein